MIWESEEERDQCKREAAEVLKDVRITPARPPAPGEDKRLTWPLCAYGDLQADEDERRPDYEGTDWFDLNYDLPGDHISVVEFRTAGGKVGYSGDILEFAADLKNACPADYLRLRLWLIAEEMDPSSSRIRN
jgi:hypothetical protein